MLNQFRLQVYSHHMPTKPDETPVILVEGIVHVVLDALLDEATNCRCRSPPWLLLFEMARVSSRVAGIMREEEGLQRELTTSDK